ncbi:SDR family oxidoreductase [Streptomyces sp. WELS2]|uniref:SDR family oxidoreductase n=1 Tax=Streptomyces sp. WELS2 TaxID=2749435 RepID=UPI0015F0D6D1|nr:SDR family oxidoreductase [Streptomyces sp. WELS2]
MERHLTVIAPAPAGRTRPAIPPLAPDTMVLTDDPRLAARMAALPRPSAPLVVCTAPAGPGVTYLARAEEGAIEALWGRQSGGSGRRPLRHVRAVTDLRGTAWPQLPGQPLLTLQELLFLAAKHLSSDRPDGSSLAVVVLDPLRGGVPHPHAALLTGFVKCASWELPGTRTYAVVTDSPHFDTALDELAHESGVTGGLPVGYYRGGARGAERLVPAPLTVPSRHDPVTDGTVIVAVGGARGITATALCGLPARTRPVVWLLGSTPLAALADRARELGGTGRVEYLRRRLTASPGLPVAEAGAEWDRLQHARQALHTLATLRRRCGSTRVHYLTCDVTDPAAVREAAGRIHRVSGRVDLLLHAAGIGRARALRNKSLAAFREVRSVKVDGYHNLKAAFASPRPATWCTFSSIAGVLGLPGECDYGPANDTLNAAARYEVLRGHDERAIAWTMWSDSGLGPRSGFTDLTRRTGLLSLLGDAEGQRLFTAELTAPPGLGNAVPVFLGRPERRTIDGHCPGLVSRQPAFAFFHTPVPLLPDEPATCAVWPVDLRPYPYLLGHQRNATALLPGALAVELAVASAGHLVPGGTAREVTRIRFHAPIAVSPRHTRYELYAAYTPCPGGPGLVRVEIRSIALPAAPPRPRPGLHFSADVIIGVPPVPASPPPPRAAPPRGRPLPRGAAVRLSRPFDTVRLLRVDEQGVRARCRLDLTGQDTQHFARMATCWLVMDAVLQTAGYLAPGRLATPRAVHRIHLPAGLSNDHALATSGADIILIASPERHHAHATATTAHGTTVLVRMEGLELA